KSSMDMELYPATYWLVGYFGTAFVLGTVTNAAVAFASYQDSRLRNSCNILIALASIADCLHLSGQIVLVYAFATGNLLMSVYTCVWIEFLPMVGFNSGCAFTVAIGIDRLFACFSPIAYGQKSPGLYIGCHLTGVFLYLCFHFHNVYTHLYPTELICMVPSNYLGEAKGVWWIVSLGCCILSVVVYAVVGIRIKTSNMRGHEMRLFKSLAVILVTVIGGYVGTFATANILIANIKEVDFKMGVLMDLIIGIPVNASLCTNYLVYYATSSEYRRVFRIQLAFLTGRSTSVK
ncbi:hypothetical protein PENTCL1PPCAC_15405, partial [Pristionchus entomophagus]